jgi:hypothetical protein
MTNEQKLNTLLAANREVAASDEQTDNQVQELTEGFDNLFMDDSKAVAFNSANQLNKTARLTQLATEIANRVFQEATDDLNEFAPAIKASQKSHDAMDDLIGEIVDLGAVDVDFLKSVSEEELEKMIRSQQSKRSRAKSKAMTQENYMTMMTGAVAEQLLRLVAGKPKSSGGGTVMGEIGFSAEDLEKLAEYPEDLKKAIRNVQSKKSIMKSKVDYDPQSARWLQLVRAEQQLKEVRDRVNGIVNEQAAEAIEVKKKAEEMLANVDTEGMSSEDAIKLLAQMKEMLANK